MTHYRENSRPIFIIWSPDYTYMHSGVRCLFLLCHHLNNLGYEAYISGNHAPSGLFVRFADNTTILEIISNNNDVIAIYPEVLKENIFEIRNVVRYLLNKPGKFSDISVDDYAPNELYVHYADEFVPQGINSHLLYIPTLDRSVFHEKSENAKRKGFLIYSVRVEPDLSSLPEWVYPRIVLSSRSPAAPATLAAFYQSSEALITWERTAAVTEAIHCGCPVILVPNPTFDHETIVRRHFGCGVTVGWDPDSLAKAVRSLPAGKYRYRLRSSCYVQKIRDFAEHAQHYFGRGSQTP